MNRPLPPVSYSQLLRENRDFRNLWLGQVVSQLGDWFNLITLQALLLRLTGEATWVAGLFVAQSLPLILLGPTAGVLVDRLPRKAVMIAADVGRGVVALGFLLVHDRATAWLVYPLFGLLAVFSVFFEPARTATLPNVTDERQLVTANALSAVSWSVLLSSGALIGGLAAEFLGYHAAFLLNALSFFASALFIARVQVPPTRGAGHAAGGFGALLDGIRYVRARPYLAGLLTAKMAWLLTGGSQSLVPVFGQRIFPLPNDRTGALTISVLIALRGLGTALGPILGRRIAGSSPRRMASVVAGAFLFAAVWYCALGSAGSLAGVGAALLLSHMGGSVIWVFSTVLLQLATEDRYRGRVFAAETMFFTITMMLSNVAVGRAVDTGIPASTVAWVLGWIALGVGLAWVVVLGLARRRNAIAE